MTSAEKLSASIELLREVRDLFKHSLRVEPASDWYVDVADVLTHAGMSAEDRQRAALNALGLAWGCLDAMKPAGVDALRGRWLALLSPVTSGLGSPDSQLSTLSSRL